MTADDLAVAVYRWPAYIVINKAWCLRIGARTIGCFEHEDIAQRICALVNEHGLIDVEEMST